ncbi:c-type cytochrome [Sphingomonas abaci]|uniref:Cytochrome c n=1 Tax=Sphingomonas abaci TaxID=237611 RepID=A0A7W7ALD1_9SPHN|nr:c-type cytochrome [Sphingomonas abaci]MBB4618270.1 cytochrome c [Sphingomonas abaci]
MKRAAALAMLLLASACGGGDAERERRIAAAGSDPRLADWLRVGDAAQGERLFHRCASCHAARAGAPDRNGPNLYGVVGKPLGRVSPSFSYSYALRTASGRWTVDRLDRWLAGPQAVVPGTSMPDPGLHDPLDRADVVAFLCGLDPGSGAAAGCPVRR